MSILLADIDATCSNLGYHDGTSYYIEDDALQSLKVSFSLFLTKNANFNEKKILFFLAFNLDIET
jgi:hypothetical protein